LRSVEVEGDFSQVFSTDGFGGEVALNDRGDFMAIEDRGFASMDRNKQREIASKGGRAAHKKGAAHEWTREEAQAAGRKGGLARHRRPDDTLASDAASTLPPVSSTSESSLIDER
jgi:general stress protein YciG